jgi:hypothetical protein
VNDSCVDSSGDEIETHQMTLDMGDAVRHSGGSQVIGLELPSG